MNLVQSHLDLGLQPLRQLVQHVPQPMHQASLLPGFGPHVADRPPQAQSAVADGQDRCLQAAALQVPQDTCPALRALPVPALDHDRLLYPVTAQPRRTSVHRRSASDGPGKARRPPTLARSPRRRSRRRKDRYSSSQADVIRVMLDADRPDGRCEPPMPGRTLRAPSVVSPRTRRPPPPAHEQLTHSSLHLAAASSGAAPSRGTLRTAEE